MSELFQLSYSSSNLQDTLNRILSTIKQHDKTLRTLVGQSNSSASPPNSPLAHLQMSTQLESMIQHRVTLEVARSFAQAPMSSFPDFDDKMGELVQYNVQQQMAIHPPTDASQVQLDELRTSVDAKLNEIRTQQAAAQEAENVIRQKVCDTLTEVVTKVTDLEQKRQQQNTVHQETQASCQQLKSSLDRQLHRLEQAEDSSKHTVATCEQLRGITDKLYNKMHTLEASSTDLQATHQICQQLRSITETCARRIDAAEDTVKQTQGRCLQLEQATNKCSHRLEQTEAQMNTLSSSNTDTTTTPTTTQFQTLSEAVEAAQKKLEVLEKEISTCSGYSHKIDHLTTQICNIANSQSTQLEGIDQKIQQRVQETFKSHTPTPDTSTTTFSTSSSSSETSTEKSADGESDVVYVQDSEKHTQENESSDANRKDKQAQPQSCDDTKQMQSRIEYLEKQLAALMDLVQTSPNNTRSTTDAVDADTDKASTAATTANDKHTEGLSPDTSSNSTETPVPRPKDSSDGIHCTNCILHKDVNLNEMLSNQPWIQTLNSKVSECETKLAQTHSDIQSVQEALVEYKEEHTKQHSRRPHQLDINPPPPPHLFLQPPTPRVEGMSKGSNSNANTQSSTSSVVHLPDIPSLNEDDVIPAVEHLDEANGEAAFPSPFSANMPILPLDDIPTVDGGTLSNVPASPLTPVVKVLAERLAGSVSTATTSVFGGEASMKPYCTRCFLPINAAEFSGLCPNCVGIEAAPLSAEVICSSAQISNSILGRGLVDTLLGSISDVSPAHSPTLPPLTNPQDWTLTPSRSFIQGLFAAGAAQNEEKRNTEKDKKPVITKKSMRTLVREELESILTHIPSVTSICDENLGSDTTTEDDEEQED